MRFVIVGAGLAGSWLTNAAKAAGHHVTLVSDGHPSADRAALAMLRPSWVSKDERALLEPSFACWEPLTDVLRGARVTRWDNDTVKEQADWVAIKPALPTVAPDELVNAHAQPLDRRRVWLGKDYLEGDVVVWCDGAGAGKYTYGCTWVHPDPEVATHEGLRTHHVAPYKVLAAARFDTEVRVGSSSSVHLDTALRQADAFFAAALDAGMIRSPKGWRREDGHRLLRPQYLTNDGPSGWRWAGFHRNGFGLVPALADAAVARITATEELL